MEDWSTSCMTLHCSPKVILSYSWMLAPLFSNLVPWTADFTSSLHYISLLSPFIRSILLRFQEAEIAYSIRINISLSLLASYMHFLFWNSRKNKTKQKWLLTSLVKLSGNRIHLTSFLKRSSSLNNKELRGRGTEDIYHYIPVYTMYVYIHTIILLLNG